MGPDSQEALVRVVELVRAIADAEVDDERLEELAVLVRGASAGGASADEIAAAGGLSVVWVRSVLGLTDEPVRDRLGRSVWIL